MKISSEVSKATVTLVLTLQEVKDLHAWIYNRLPGNGEQIRSATAEQHGASIAGELSNALYYMAPK